MRTVKLGSSGDILEKNLCIQLSPEETDRIIPFENIVLQFKDKELIIPVERVFNKLKELFEEE